MPVTTKKPIEPMPEWSDQMAQDKAQEALERAQSTPEAITRSRVEGDMDRKQSRQIFVAYEMIERGTGATLAQTAAMVSRYKGVVGFLPVYDDLEALQWMHPRAPHATLGAARAPHVRKGDRDVPPPTDDPATTS